MFTGQLSEKHCFVCGTQDNTLEVKMKDKTFHGVVCVGDLMKLLKRAKASEKKPEVKT